MDRMQIMGKNTSECSICGAKGPDPCKNCATDSGTDKLIDAIKFGTDDESDSVKDKDK
jgi:hypothetical protein